MRQRERVLVFVAVLAAVLLVKLGGDVYEWYVHADERARIAELSEVLNESGMEIVATQMAADSLHALIETMDAGLRESRRRVESYGRHARDGALAPLLYEGYRRELDGYNRRVSERNARFEVWEETISRNHAAVARYNEVADSIRRLAAAMGEPYFTIPTPAEIALDRGISAPVRP